MSHLPDGIDDINDTFCIADWLAIHYQKKTILTLRSIHVLAFLMGLMYILYLDLASLSYYMFAFLAFFLVSASIHYVAKRDGWHRKYLDYRTLAEGLRVQFYWAAEWDFGDGNGAFGSSADHSFDLEGTYFVTLTVTDAGGAQSSTQLQPYRARSLGSKG